MDTPKVLDRSNAVRGKFQLPVKEPVMLRLFIDVIHWIIPHPDQPVTVRRTRQADCLLAATFPASCRPAPSRAALTLA
jgi:hypothetical protein